MSLSFRDHRFEPPKYTVEQCRDKDFTYSAPLFVTAEFMNNEVPGASVPEDVLERMRKTTTREEGIAEGVLLLMIVTAWQLRLTLLAGVLVYLAGLSAPHNVAVLGTAAGAAHRVRESRARPGTQGQNTYLSRASTLRSAPNQQLFWS